MNQRAWSKFGLPICLFTSTLLLIQWNYWEYNKLSVKYNQLFEYSRFNQLPVNLRFVNLKSLHLNLSISEKEESVFVGSSENVEKYFKSYYANFEDHEQILKEFILKRQIVNQILEMKYFVQSKLMNKSKPNIGLFLSRLQDRERSVTNLILPLLKFANESQSRNKRLVKIDRHTFFSNPKIEKNFEFMTILQLHKSIESMVGYIKYEASNNSNWKSHTKAINTELRKTLKDAKSILKKGSDRRKQELAKLQKRVQLSFRKIQNPQNCQTSKRLICEIDYRCGFGCIVHYLGVCMTEAFGTNRTLFVKLKRFIYKTNLTSVLLPFSDTCNLTGKEKLVHFKDPNAAEALVIFMPMDQARNVTSLFRPGTIPAVIAPQLLGSHPEPAIWWTGQLFGFICRPQQTIKEEINSFMKAHRFHEPIVGVHVRRTDKIDETAYVDLYRYMEAVEEWFLQYEVDQNVSKIKRKIFLASDEGKIIEEAKKGYPNYEIVINDASNTKYARSSEDGLHTVTMDVHLLSHCDFLVCTLSSNICRLAYALLQTYKPENTQSVFSMDKAYLYYFGWPRKRIAVKGHIPNNKQELIMTPGDVIYLPLRICNGHKRWGVNLRTRHNGNFSIYKTRDLLVLAPYVILDF